MIICFSGTGNTRYVSDMLSDALGDHIVRLPASLLSNPEKAVINIPDGRAIWAFPIHCWGVPPRARDVMARCTLKGDGEILHYMVATCGDDIGNAAGQWRRTMRRRGWKTAAAYSVQMPNNYTFMKGFDVDSAELARRKLEAAPMRVAHIAGEIAGGGGHDDIVRGRWPWIKTSIIYRWFGLFMTSTRPFHVTDECSGCGRCIRNCAMATISMVDGKPSWGEVCSMCARCYHCCPHHAVAYGKATRGKGQYLCPSYDLE